MKRALLKMDLGMDHAVILRQDKLVFQSALHISEHFTSAEYIIRENTTVFSCNILEFYMIPMPSVQTDERGFRT